MEPIKITKERMEVLLPQNIKESDAISYNAKKLLATLINYFVTVDKVKEQGYLYMSNETLRTSLGINKSNMLCCIAELKDHDLIDRKAGQTRQVGEKSLASSYYIKWDNLIKPLKKLTFEDIFSSFINNPQTPMGTADTNTNSDININIDLDTDINIDIKTDKEINKETDKNAEADLDIDTNNNSNIDTNMIILNEKDLNYFDYLNNNLNKTADTSDECPRKEEKAVAVDNTVPQEELSFNDVFPSLEEIERRKEEKRQALTQHIKELEQSKELQEALALMEKELEEQSQREQAEEYFKRWGTYPDGWNTDSKKKELVPAAEEVLPF